MLTLKRFASLADSYGGQPTQWPEDLRNEAEALLRSSAEARIILDRARTLDEAIGAARSSLTPDIAAAFDAAALQRLRSAVALRIGSSGRDRSPHRPFFWLLSPPDQGSFVTRSGCAGVAAGSAVAIVAGAIIGALYAPAIPRVDILSMLQSGPVQIFPDR